MIGLRLIYVSKLPLLMVELKKVVLDQRVSEYNMHPEYPKFGAYRKRNKFVKVLNDRIWDLPAPVNLNAW